MAGQFSTNLPHSPSAQNKTSAPPLDLTPWGQPSQTSQQKQQHTTASTTAETASIASTSSFSSRIGLLKDKFRSSSDKHSSSSPSSSSSSSSPSQDKLQRQAVKSQVRMGS